MLGLARSDGWVLERVDGAVIARAGADHLFAIDELDDDELIVLERAWAIGTVDKDALPLACGVVVDQLVALGALVPREDSPSVVAVVGAPGALRDAVCVALRATATDYADLTVVLRSAGTLADIAALARGLGPHLLVDAAYHHTLVLGPLVIPGTTACVDCLVLRIGERWGDDLPPPRPAIAGRTALVAGHTAAAVEAARAGTSPLVGASVALDLMRLTATSERLLRHPRCPTCRIGATAEVECSAS